MQTLVHAASLRPRVEVAQKTDPGRDPDKQVNEDALAYRPTPFGHLLVVCDGMGGHHHGEEASNTALRTVLELLESAPLDAPVRHAIAHAVHMANDRVHALGTPDSAAHPGSTIVLALLQSSGAVLAHVGDSRAYLVRQGNALSLTKDHSVVQQMVDQGMITAEQAIGHPDANRILRALGVAPGVDVDVRADNVPFAAGDAFVLCTDGLTDLVTGPEIARVVAEAPSLDQAAQRLIDLANERGGHDNISVLIARVLDDCTAAAAPTIVNTRPDTVPDRGPQTTQIGGPPPGHPHTPMQPMPPQHGGYPMQPGPQMAPMMPMGPVPVPPSSGSTLPQIAAYPHAPGGPPSDPSIVPSRRRTTTNHGVERGILVAGVVLVVLLLAVLAAVTGVLLARPRPNTPAFVDGSVAPSAPPTTVAPPPSDTVVPDVVPAEGAQPLPSLTPAPSGSQRPPFRRKPTAPPQ